MISEIRKGLSQMKRQQKGFTLIELMIVIAIIAILAAILIPNFIHARAESQTAACEGNEKQIATAMEEYAVDNQGQYTTTIPALYLAVTPKDPVNNVAYVISTSIPAAGSYQISDTGGHDQTTMGNLNQTSGTTCGQATCSTIQYNQNSGLLGK
jgi:prepilin-type N-terminal cleavage/methylation domain-containing protein